jgi:hypothetical protein
VGTAKLFEDEFVEGLDFPDLSRHILTVPVQLFGDVEDTVGGHEADLALQSFDQYIGSTDFLLELVDAPVYLIEALVDPIEALVDLIEALVDLIEAPID